MINYHAIQALAEEFKIIKKYTYFSSLSNTSVYNKIEQIKYVKYIRYPLNIHEQILLNAFAFKNYQCSQTMFFFISFFCYKKKLNAFFNKQTSQAKYTHINGRLCPQDYRCPSFQLK